METQYGVFSSDHNRHHLPPSSMKEERNEWLDYLICWHAWIDFLEKLKDAGAAAALTLIQLPPEREECDV